MTYTLFNVVKCDYIQAVFHQSPLFQIQDNFLLCQLFATKLHHAGALNLLSFTREMEEQIQQDNSDNS